jgi:predicted ArsR family transcriptional regulator
MERRRAVAAIAALDDDVRNALYTVVCDADSAVTREAAADAVGISRKLAAFHLDKLVAAGLLDARIGTGVERRVGRAPKVYERAAEEVAVHVPPREPELLAGILVDAVLDERPDERAGQAVLRVARERGRAAGAAERARVRPGRVGTERALALAGTLLRQHGFEPGREPGGLRLRNCPFHPLAAAAPELVCGLNHAFLGGVLEGLHADGCVEAQLAPRPGSCCVRLRPRTDPS